MKKGKKKGRGKKVGEREGKGKEGRIRYVIRVILYQSPQKYLHRVVVVYVVMAVVVEGSK